MPDLAGDAVLCVLYIALNAALNFTNRWALGVHGFSFPLVLTAAHMLLNPVLLAPMMLLAKAYKGVHGRVLCSQWRALFAIAALNGIQIGLNNSSLVYIELSLNQVVRATVPVFVACFQCLVTKKPPSVSHMVVLVILSLGVIFVVYQPEAMGGQLFGVLLVVSSVSMQAGQMVFAGNLLSEKLDSFQITFYTSPMAFSVLAMPTAVIDGSAFAGFAAKHPGVTAAVLIGTCVLAVLYNVVLFQTIRRLSAVGSAVLGNVKVVVLLLLSSLLMGEMQRWTSLQYVGCAMTFGGAAMYSALKMRASSAGGGGGKKHA